MLTFSLKSIKLSITEQKLFIDVISLGKIARKNKLPHYKTYEKIVYEQVGKHSRETISSFRFNFGNFYFYRFSVRFEISSVFLSVSISLLPHVRRNIDVIYLIETTLQ